MHEISPKNVELGSAVSEFPKGPKIEKIQSRLKFSVSLETSISLEILNLDLQTSPQKIGVCWVARLKFSISIENFNPGRRS